MRASDQTTEQLHQQASAHYLQGKFNEALAVWRQILAADPDDERANEGLRLCELLTDDGAVAAGAMEAPVAEPAPEAAPEAVAAAADGPIEFEVPDLDLDLPALDDVGAEPEAVPSVEPEAVAPHDPSVQGDGMELDEEPVPLDLAGPVSAPPEDASTQEIVAAEMLPDPEDLGEDTATEDPEMAIPEADVEFAAPAAGLDAAETELQRRVRDLMKEANEAFRSGDNDAARSVLARVFILDESDEEALQLQEQIENGVPPATDHVDVAELDAPDHDAAPGEFDLDSDDPDALLVEAVAAPEEELPEFDLPDVPVEVVEGEPVLEVAPEVLPETLAAPASTDDALQLDAIEAAPEKDLVTEILDEPVVDVLEDEVLMDEPEEPAVAPAEGKRIRLPQFDVSSSKTRYIVLGGVVLIVAVVGAGFWMKLQGTKIRDEPLPLNAVQAEAEAQEAGAGTPSQQAPAGAPAVSDAAPTEIAVADAGTFDAAAQMAEGRAAMEAGDYAAAMVSFHAVAEHDPTHLEATERLQAATDGYRRQQEIEKQWLAASALFRDGEYRSAMKMFYRLEPTNAESAARLERYKLNGWYNMAVLALRSGDCDLARSHLTEAAQIDAGDVDVLTAQALCDSCDAGPRKTGFQRAIQVISLRGIGD